MYHIIQNLRSDSRKTFKEEALKAELEHELFKRILHLTYSPLIRFGIKEIPAYQIKGESLSLEQAVEALTPLTEGLRGNAGKELLVSVLEQVSENDAKVLKLMIGGSLRAGFEVRTINKVFGKGFVPEAPYMGAVSYSKTKVLKLFRDNEVVFSQLKADGRYSNILVGHDGIEMESRQGLPTDFGNEFDFMMEGLESFGEEFVLNGEMTIPGLDRKTANGIIRAITVIGEKIFNNEDVEKELLKFEKRYGKSYEGYRGMIDFTCWDVIPATVYRGQMSETDTKDYIERFDELQKVISAIGNSRLSVVESRIALTPAEAMEHYLELIRRGEEGTVLKAALGSSGAKWRAGKHTNQVKFKEEIFLDLKIVGFRYGEKGKANENVVSTILLESECGLLKTAASNMSKDVMKMVTRSQEELKGTIVEMKCSGLSQDREGDWSTQHPNFHGFRNDKIVANTLKECQEISEAAKDLWLEGA